MMKLFFRAHFISSKSFIAGGVIFFFCCYWLFYSSDLTWRWQISYQTRRLKDPNFNRGNLKTILLWNTFFNTKHFGFGIGREPFIKAKCPITNCTIIDRTDGLLPIPVEDFDAVWFHMVDPYGLHFPLSRKIHQRYIFFALESQVTMENRYKTDNIPLDYFNWTMTFLRTSDIYYPYGWIDEHKKASIVPVTPNPKVPKWREPDFSVINNRTDIDDTIKAKDSLVAWFVSNCESQSERLKYVEELSNYISVDIYGECGTLKCSRANVDECDTMLENKYKFYLSFENSLCKEYVTEKFFRIIKRNIVPVVYGGSDYKTIAPPMSYIDVADYKSPKEVADYLKYLDRHPEEYKKYFWWKSRYRVFDHHSYVLCLLCQMLNNSTLPVKVYHDVKSWWYTDKCYDPMEYNYVT